MLVKARGETSCRIRFLPNNSALLSSNFPTFIFWCFSGVQNRSKIQQFMEFIDPLLGTVP